MRLSLKNTKYNTILVKNCNFFEDKNKTLKAYKKALIMLISLFGKKIHF